MPNPFENIRKVPGRWVKIPACEGPTLDSGRAARAIEQAREEADARRMERATLEVARGEGRGSSDV